MQIVATVALHIHTASISDHLNYDAFDRFAQKGEAVPNPKTSEGGHGWE